MSSSSSASDSILLRPHHGLCIGFFQGKGYSDAFVRHMTEVIAMLHKADPMLTLVMHCDTLCEACPHNAGGICESAEKVHRYDAQVLALCGLTDGARLHWSAFRQAVKTQILRAGKFAEVCAGCQWETICTAACAKESV